MRYPRLSMGDTVWLAAAGTVAGVGSAVLSFLGNPVDGGVSVACFLRDIAGAFGLHQVIEFSYLRPEIAAIAFGALIASLFSKGFKPAGGSSPFARFIIGMVLAFGVFAFIGCPMRTGLRLAGGDPGALAGCAGLIAGAYGGTLFLARGFSLGKTAPAGRANGLLFHGVLVLLLVLLVAGSSFLTMSHERHAPLFIALGIGVVIGVLGQQSKLCFIGGFRNLFLIGDFTLLMGFVFLVISAMAANIVLGQMHWGVHIIGSADALWSFLALSVVGLASVLLGGCPFRQLILASQGNTDSAITITGMTAGAAIAYNYGLAFTAGSLDSAGKAAILGGGALLVLFGILFRDMGR
ncbi:MAG: YedE-related selenium metabolism membrane protein [Chitinispirillaceae bacterium]|nr:YedE-related selenium metabolism membrane protein [Chitinispirillaceae bacterium]